MVIAKRFIQDFKEPILLVLLFACWCVGITNNTINNITISSILGLAAVLIHVFIPSQNTESKRRWSYFIYASLGLIIGYWGLNVLYKEVYHLQDKIGIFRFNTPKPRFPFYSEYWEKLLYEYAQEFAVTVVGLIGLLFTYHKQKIRYAIVFGSFIMIGYSFSFEELFEGINNPLHYETFAEDVHHFPTFKSLFSDFADKMGEMGVHNNHYPPGNLALMYVQHQLGFNFAKILTILSCIGGMLLLPWLASLLGYGRKVATYAIWLMGVSAYFLLFPAIAMSPLMVPIVMLAVGFFLKSLNENGLKNAVVLGCIVILLSLFTFMWMTLPLLFLLIWWYNGRMQMLQLLKIAGIALVVFSVFYSCLFAFTGYSIIEVTLKGIQNNTDQMSNGAGQNLTTYLLASSGNAIAFIGFFGFPVVGLLLAALFSKTKEDEHQWIRPLFLFVLLLSFSGSFYLEVERIWIIFVPLLLLPVAKKLEEFKNQRNGAIIVYLMLALNLINAFVLFATTA